MRLATADGRRALVARLVGVLVEGEMLPVLDVAPWGAVAAPLTVLVVKRGQLVGEGRHEDVRSLGALRERPHRLRACWAARLAAGRQKVLRLISRTAPPAAVLLNIQLVRVFALDAHGLQVAGAWRGARATWALARGANILDRLVLSAVLRAVDVEPLRPVP